MNRQTILAAIHRQLRESLAETGEVRPLGEIVGSVAEEIRSSCNGQVATAVIPIETVAAFVDGNLSTEESEAVCQAVMVDNSVLAELVSVVRSIQQPAEQLQPLPEVLRKQLFAMQACLPLQTSLPESLDHLPIAEEPAAPTIRTEPAVRRPTPAKRRRSFKPVAAILSLAAALAAIIFLATRNNQQHPEQPVIVENKSPRPNSVAPLRPDSTSDSEIRIVDATSEPNTPVPVSPTMQPIADSEPSPVIAQQDPSNRPLTPERSIDSSVPEPTPEPMPGPQQVPGPSSLAKATELSGLRWTKVTGILTRRNEVAPTSASRMAIWESIQAGSAPVESTDGQLTLRTFPLSRAEASLPSGGRVVLGADSGMAVSKGDAAISAELRLDHGDVALIDLPEGTLIRLINAGHPLATMRWQSKASAVLQHAADGLEVHVRNGTIDISGRPQKNSSVTIDRNRAVQSIDQPKRLPVWVDRPVATINVKQTFLAQIGESKNVMGTLNQQIRGLTQNQRVTDVDARTLATLAAWQAALAGERVFRLAGSPLPAVRMAALNRIVTLPRWDPRYTRTWAMIENAARDKQRAARFKRLVFLAQQNGAASAAQINAMLDDLMAPDIASRAMSDFLLRRFHRNAARRLPNFDPTWTGQSQTRGANLWRSYLSRTSNAAQRQPAAAAANRN